MNLEGHPINPNIIRPKPGEVLIIQAPDTLELVPRTREFGFEFRKFLQDVTDEVLPAIGHGQTHTSAGSLYAADEFDMNHEKDLKSWHKQLTDRGFSGDEIVEAAVTALVYENRRKNMTVPEARRVGVFMADRLGFAPENPEDKVA